MKKNLCLMLLFFVTSMMILGCAGSKMMISAEASRYPISSSPVVFTSDGTILRPDDQEVLSHFTHNYRRWSFFSTLIPLSSYERDISSELEESIEAANGLAIVNLSVTAKPSKFTDFIAYSFSSIASLIIPTAIDVTVTGDVIKPRNPNVSIYVVPRSLGGNQ